MLQNNIFLINSFLNLKARKSDIQLRFRITGTPYTKNEDPHTTIKYCAIYLLPVVAIEIDHGQQASDEQDCSMAVTTVGKSE